MKPSSDLQKKLKSGDPDVFEYSKALAVEILKLQKRVVSLEAGLLSAKSKISALESELKKAQRAAPMPVINVLFSDPSGKPENKP